MSKRKGRKARKRELAALKLATQHRKSIIAKNLKEGVKNVILKTDIRTNGQQLERFRKQFRPILTANNDRAMSCGASAHQSSPEVRCKVTLSNSVQPIHKRTHKRFSTK